MLFKNKKKLLNSKNNNFFKSFNKKENQTSQNIININSSLKQIKKNQIISLFYFKKITKNYRIKKYSKIKKLIIYNNKT